MKKKILYLLLTFLIIFGLGGVYYIQYFIPQQNAIKLTQSSKTEGFNEPNANINSIITGTMSFIPHSKNYGWKAKRMNRNLYLVSYIFKTVKGINGFYFEANTDTNTVKNVAFDEKLLKKYKLEFIVSEDFKKKILESAVEPNYVLTDNEIDDYYNGKNYGSYSKVKKMTLDEYKQFMIDMKKKDYELTKKVSIDRVLQIPLKMINE